MIRTLRRLKRLYKLSKKDETALSTLEKLTPAQLDAVPDANEGDGKAVFIGQGTQTEYEEQQHADSGMLAWYERLKKL
jgi:hypothetical protein